MRPAELRRTILGRGENGAVIIMLPWVFRFARVENNPTAAVLIIISTVVSRVSKLHPAWRRPRHRVSSEACKKGGDFISSPFFALWSAVYACCGRAPRSCVFVCVFFLSQVELVLVDGQTALATTSASGVRRLGKGVSGGGGEGEYELADEKEEEFEQNEEGMFFEELQTRRLQSTVRFCLVPLFLLCSLTPPRPPPLPSSERFCMLCRSARWVVSSFKVFSLLACWFCKKKKKK